VESNHPIDGPPDIPLHNDHQFARDDRNPCVALHSRRRLYRVMDLTPPAARYQSTGSRLP
jgi:hypothetical protein